MRRKIIALALTLFAAGCAADGGGDKGSLAKNSESALNSKNLCSRTPETLVLLAPQEVIAASKVGDLKKISEAISSGLNPDSTDEEGFSLLHAAIVEQHNAVVAHLLKAGASSNKPFMGSSPLALARDSSNKPGAELLLSAGAKLSDFDIAQSEIASRRPRSFEHGLYDAINRGDINQLEIFVRAIYDINERDKDGMTILHAAVTRGAPESIKFLAHCGADIHAKTKRGAPVVWFARDRPDVLVVLRNLGAKD